MANVMVGSCLLNAVKVSSIHGVRMTPYIYLGIRFTSSKKNSESFRFHARLTRIRKLVTFGELSNDVDTTGKSSMRVVDSRVAISYGCPASF
jgi:hypothetical protein